jgi:hypothetical protein
VFFGAFINQEEKAAHAGGPCLLVLFMGKGERSELMGITEGVLAFELGLGFAVVVDDDAPVVVEHFHAFDGLRASFQAGVEQGPLWI